MIRHHHLYAAAIPLLALTSSALAGSAAATAPPAPPEAPNPLSFFGGQLVFDVQEKMRIESRENNFDFNDSVDSLTDDSWVLNRFRLGMKWTPTPFMNIYLQGQDTREWGSRRPNVIGSLGAEGDDSFDLRQGFIELGSAKSGWSGKIGRQTFLYGDERLVGPLEWANQGRTFDAVRLRYASEKWWVEAFASSVVKFKDGSFNESDWLDDDATRDQIFSGVYFSTTAIGKQTTDFYVFHLEEEFAAGDTGFFTLGTRMKSTPGAFNGWDYDTEMAVQTGDVRGRDLSAFAGHWGVGYTFAGHAWKPRLGLEYNYGTGDGNAADGDVDTFQNLFPTNHKFYGYMDVFSWQNIHNVALSASASPNKKTKVQLDYHLFWLADTGDGWYRANGTTLVRPVSPGADSFAGSEIDLTVSYKASKNVMLQAGYSHFFAGDYLSASGASDDASFAYGSVQFDF
jgi:Alginate export